MPETIYGKYFLTDDRGPVQGPDFTSFKSHPPLSEIADPQAYFRGESQIPGASASIGWQVFIKPYRLETIPHTHDVDEFLIFLGAKLPDVFDSFKAEIDLWMGEELEKHTITSATVVFIPKGLLHCPLNLRIIDEPVLFHALHLGPRFTAKRVENWDSSRIQF